MADSCILGSRVARAQQITKRNKDTETYRYTQIDTVTGTITKDSVASPWLNQPAKSGDVVAGSTAGATTTSPINSRHYPSRIRVGDRVGDRVGVGVRVAVSSAARPLPRGTRR